MSEMPEPPAVHLGGHNDCLICATILNTRVQAAMDEVGVPWHPSHEDLNRAFPDE